jgi:HSP20 family protein
MTMMSMRDIAPRTGGGSRVPAVFRDEPASLFAALRQEVDRLFDEALRGFGTPAARFGLGAGWPSVELTETDKEIRVTFEVPGVEEKDVEVLLEDGELVVRGEKRGETEDEERRFTERFYGRFERRIPLRDEVDQEQVRAEFRNGVLTVTAPKSAQAEQRAKRIPVNAGAAAA